MSTTQTPSPVVEPLAPTSREVVVYGHSPLFYWWPVWVLGYVMAVLTYLQGSAMQMGDAEVIIHPSKSLGVIYMAVFLLVLLMTHTSVRGIASLTVIIALLAVTFLFAYLRWWDDIFRAMGRLALFMNLGFYVFFSSAVLLAWVLAFFVFDRFNYWTFRPGQVLHSMVFGGGAMTYDTQGMSVYKLRDDLFRHWVLGLGAGDMRIATSGAKKEELVVPNVLWIGGKLRRIQQLVAMKPDETIQNVVVVGEPT
jgi:hypothetical protein